MVSVSASRTDERIGGVVPIISCPFTDDGDVDYESLRNLAETLADGGSHALALFGLASEYYKLTDREREAMLDVVAGVSDETGVPLVVNVTHHATEVAVEQARDAERAGADALMVLPPFFLGPSGPDVLDHVTGVGEAVSIPVIVQYAPEETGVALSPDDLHGLAERVDAIEYFKVEAVPPGRVVTELLAQLDGEGDVLIGQAGAQMIEAYDRGAVGVMPGAPLYDVYLTIHDHYVRGQRDRAVEIHSDLIALLNHTTQSLEMALAYGKRILQRRGVVESDYCRAPRFEPDDHHDRVFEELYADVEPYLD